MWRSAVYIAGRLPDNLHDYPTHTHSKENGRKVTDLGNAKICSADTKSVEDIAVELRTKAQRTRSGKDKDFEAGKPLLRALPVWAIRRVVQAVGTLGAQFGISVPPLGVRAYPFGSCMVSLVLEVVAVAAYASHTTPSACRSLLLACWGWTRRGRHSRPLHTFLSLSPWVPSRTRSSPSMVPQLCAPC